MINTPSGEAILPLSFWPPFSAGGLLLKGSKFYKGRPILKSFIGQGSREVKKVITLCKNWGKHGFTVYPYTLTHIADFSSSVNLQNSRISSRIGAFSAPDKKG